MKQFVAYLSAKPGTGLLVTASAWFLKLVGIVGPYLAFAGICLGISVSIYSLRVKRLEKRKLQMEIEALKSHSSGSLK